MVAISLFDCSETFFEAKLAKHLRLRYRVVMHSGVDSKASSGSEAVNTKVDRQAQEEAGKPKDGPKCKSAMSAAEETSRSLFVNSSENTPIFVI